MKKGKLRDRIRIERPVKDNAFDGAGSGSWALVGHAWAEVEDMIPSRGDRMADGINVSRRPARVRMAYRSGITSAMRIVLLDGDRQIRTAVIITPPATLGRKEGLEFIVEDFAAAGNRA